MPSQHTINSTLNEVATDLADAGIRPPAVVVIGSVVAVASELAELARDLASASLAEDIREYKQAG
jgi:uroporphyrin-III C-methyltransferase/precorrin-2 dehydrogenase/sirohydrochlorin ferrochelatase